MSHLKSCNDLCYVNRQKFFLGNLDLVKASKDLRANFFLHEMHETYGPIVGFGLLGGLTLVSVADPDLIRQVNETVCDYL